jgi:CelD/BcsL family acetyltransferase involved in cellulose biosynthesis
MTPRTLIAGSDAAPNGRGIEAHMPVTVSKAKAAVLDTIYPFNPLNDPRWEAFLSSEPRSSVFHGKAWLLALNQTYQYDPLGFTCSAPGKPFRNALAFCRVNSWLTGQRLVSLPFSDHCEPLVDGVDELNELLTPALQELREGKIKYVDIRPLSLSFSGETEGAESYFIHLLDLRPTLEELYKKLHGDSIRRKIQRAEREKLTLEVGSSEKMLADFYKLHITTRQRQQLPPHPLRWFRNILGCLGADAQIRVARKDGSAIASIFTLGHKQKMVYKYGCSDAHSHNLGGMQFLFWDLIRYAKEHGFVELDFGRSECTNTGLVTFKDRWGTKRQLITYLRYPRRPVTTEQDPSMIMKLGKKVFSHCPQGVLRLAGNLLYPHVG